MKRLATTCALSLTLLAVAHLGASAERLTTATSAARPLSGITIALDPGHQLGNSNPRFRVHLKAKRFQGRIWKSCNTTGSATAGGYPEATFNWQVARILRRHLLELGAQVPMTRNVNNHNHWGPCT